MKKHTLPVLALCFSAIATFTITSCQNDEISQINNESNVNWRSNTNSFLYPPSAHPLGKSYNEWGEEFWKLTYAEGCEALFAGGLYELSENVITYSALVSDSEVNITISKDQAFFLPIASVVYDYPCPDAEFEPAPGQSLEEFLQEGAVAYMNDIENLSFSFDGNQVSNLADYLFMSDLFYFTGNPEIIECYDPCITGEPQPGVHHGYYVMFKKMSQGAHTIVMHGEVPAYDYTWDMVINITVE